MPQYAPSIRAAAAAAGMTPEQYLDSLTGAHSSGTNDATSGGTTYAPAILQVAEEQGISPTQAATQLTDASHAPGVGSVPGLNAVANVWDPVSGDWYYVQAESINGQERVRNALEGGIAYAPGSPTHLELTDMGVPNVPNVTMNAPTIPTFPGGPSFLNQQYLLAEQGRNILPGTTMETNFGSGPPGVVNPPQQRPEETPQENARYAPPPPGVTAPSVDVATGGRGSRQTDLIAGSRNALDVYVSPDSPGALASGLTLRRR